MQDEYIARAQDRLGPCTHLSVERRSAVIQVAGFGPVRFHFRRCAGERLGAHFWRCERAESMMKEALLEDDPTGEEEALEFDGTKTDQLGESYRRQVVADSEKDTGAVHRDNDWQLRDPSAIDRATGYDPYETVVESEPPEGFAGTKRNVKPPKSGAR